MSTLDFRDLPEDRLATTDKDGARVWIVPARVKGVWQNRRIVFQTFLLLIFILTPWLRWQGHPLLLFDIYNRQFVFLGKVFGAHDGPLLFFVLGLLAFGLIIATAIWGRIWCGWACPQTVFVERIYRGIERWVVGNRATQLKVSQQPFVWKHFRKLVMKWSLFILTSAFLAHTFIAYFVSWERLMHMMSQPPAESWTVFLFVIFFTGILLFDFAWFREQFCIIMCPYGRFQSVLMDQNTVTISYDHKRGEPRGKGLKKDPAKGDCIDCYKCVSVCPTGIDIRRGTQLECIACTACIDACDEVMEKIKRPKGLIRYAALSDIEKQGRKFWRPRLFLYFGAITLLLLGFVYSLSQHESFYYAVLRQNQRPYVVEGNTLLNNYKVHLKNPGLEPVEYEIQLITEGYSLAPDIMQGQLEANGSIHRPFFIKKNNWSDQRQGLIELRIRHRVDGQWSEEVVPVHMVGPKD